MKTAHEAIEQAFLRERGQVLATLIGRLGDIDLAEEALQDALVAALTHWPRDGVPNNVGAWLTTAARRKAIDRIRRSQTQSEFSPEQLETLPPNTSNSAALGVADDLENIDEIPDERLKLIFTCCHPALPTDQQVALTLHTLGGLTTAEIATAFLTPLPTLAQRLVRAKKKIKDARIPYQVPSTQILADRIESVLLVIYLIFSEGYAASTGDALIRHELCDEAIRLCQVLDHLIKREHTDVPPPQYAEVLGLLALMLLHHSRRGARVGAMGELVLLPDQDRSKWDANDIAKGLALIEQALLMRTPGPYQMQAAISALHAQAPTATSTDWPQIMGLYNVLLTMIDTPVIRVNHAIAVSQAQGHTQGLKILDELQQNHDLEAFYPFYVARAHMLKQLGQFDAAQIATMRALDLCQNDVERAALLRQFNVTP